MAEMISRDAVIQAVSDQVSSVLGADTVVLQLKTGTYYGLNEVGSKVWALIQQPISFDRIQQAVVDEYDVDDATCERDLLELLAGLRQANLVTIQPQG